MNQTKLPEEWDDEKVQRVPAHYEGQTDEEALAPDEANRTEQRDNKSANLNPPRRAFPGGTGNPADERRRIVAASGRADQPRDRHPERLTLDHRRHRLAPRSRRWHGPGFWLNL